MDHDLDSRQEATRDLRRRLLAIGAREVAVRSAVPYVTSPESLRWRT